MAATTTKTKKIQSHFPPREIRDNTKARRAWLAAKAAEINAQAGRSARIVGNGSYQEVAEYEVREVEGRVQVRGTCQCCGGDVAVEGGEAEWQRTRTAHHGYTRPGYGWQTASCEGARSLPYELGHAKLDSLLVALRQYEARLVGQEAALRAGTVTTVIRTVGYGRRAETVEITADTADALADRLGLGWMRAGTVWQAVLNNAADLAAGELRHLRRDIASQQARREAWVFAPQALRNVVVA